ncbi:hypothetical protein SCD90_07580 [Terrihabitans sp. PJ23]|uniref:General secretion pathway protein N n=1 Tax=Terrihabitans rhizophilus TaxID=3092662 RepID=A0ABU4RT10_9HYPH|nr:hypothetical protein [Terrihabitans sp. PJ23]
MRTHLFALAAIAAILPALSAVAVAQAVGTTGAVSIERGGNPLWAVPLDDLEAQRERPLFSPTRRPPPAQEIAAPPPAAPPAAPAPPALPPLQLIGTIKVGGGGYGLFTSTISQVTITLRPGEAFGGWTLLSLLPRSAVVASEGREVVLALPEPDIAAVPGPPGAPSDKPDPVNEPIFYPEH